MLTRKDAERLLMAPGNGRSSFLVRESETGPSKSEILYLSINEWGIQASQLNIWSDIHNIYQ